jgi:hypothetical protein
VAAAVKVVADADGGASLVGTVGGVELVFATVNASQVNEARLAQGKPAETQADDEIATGEDGG